MFIHGNTVGNWLYGIDLHRRVAQKQLDMNKINREKTIAYAKTMMKKPFDYRKCILWSDEAKFNLFGFDGKTIVWRSMTEEHGPKCAVPTVKYNGECVMVWGCLSRGGIGNLCFIENAMNRFCYREIFQKNILQSLKKLALENVFIFPRDNGPKRTGRVVKN